jgi:hypothetical protein
MGSVGMVRGIFSLRLELDKILQSEEYEQLVFENLDRCKRLVGNRFQVIFWHKDLDTEKIEEFTLKNKDKLFELSSHITGQISNVWFLIKSSKEEKSTWRYMHDGDILEGIVEYLKIINHIQKRDSK